jgi:transcriptional regulator with XRE-family HTH domain
MNGEPEDPGAAGLWCKTERTTRGWSASDLATRINGLAAEHGDTVRVSQQVISKFEQGNTKRKPSWVRFIAMALEDADEGTGEDPYLSVATTDAGVLIRLLPTFAGMGAGGTGDGDEGYVSMSRDLIERELRAPAASLLAMVAEGNSMEPDFEGGDQILVDTRRKSLAQPGPFCLWDVDGHVVKYVERVHNSDPPRVRLVSKNADLYPPVERLLDEVSLVGRVIWYGRKVQ